MNYDPKSEAISISKKSGSISKLNEEGKKNFFQTTEKYEDKIKRCMSVFRTLPWLKEVVDEIFICPKIIDTKYYDENKFIEYDSKKFFRVKMQYYLMRCLGKIQSIDEDNNITIEYENEIVTFQVGLKLKKKKGLIIQNSEMFEEEQKYLTQLKKSNINITTLKNASVSYELKKIAIAALDSYTPNDEFLNIMVNNVENESNTAYEFAQKIALILTASKYNPIFNSRLSKNYYNEETIHSLDYDELFDGIDKSDTEKIKNYVDDTATNFLVLAHKYYDIPTRKYQKHELKPLVLNRINIKLRCDNFEEIKNIPDENLAFYDKDKNKFLCYDISQLYRNFENGNTINPHSGIPFSSEFVDKIKSIYKFKSENFPVKTRAVETDDWSDSDYDDVINKIEEKNDPIFNQILEKVRLEIENLMINKNGELISSAADKCVLCKNNVGKMGVITIDRNGDIVKHCSKNCFDKN